MLQANCLGSGTGFWEFDYYEGGTCEIFSMKPEGSKKMHDGPSRRVRTTSFITDKKRKP